MGIQKLSKIIALESCTITDPVETAKTVGLKYVTDSEPGMTRKRIGSDFIYLSRKGDAVTDPEVIKRIKSLVIPPAWTNVWICPFENGHLQATGRDAKGRKQYRYHKLWAEVRNETKFDRMAAFGASLPLIRERIERDLSGSGLTRERVLAAVLRLLEISLMRVGNEEYAKINGSFGITTLREKHVEVAGYSIRLNFRAKSGKDRRVKIVDRRLAGIARRLVDLPGQELFRYFDEDGTMRTIESGDVNSHIFEITGDRFTAKDFRTWGGTVQAARALAEIGSFSSAADAKKNIVQAVRTVASILGNREPICRKYYIHPAIIDAYLDGSLVRKFKRIRWNGKSNSVAKLNKLKPEEMAVLRILSERDTQSARAA